MGKPVAAGRKWGAASGEHALVGPTKGSSWATEAHPGGVVEPSGAALGETGAPHLRSGLWPRSLALAALALSTALCGALEERQPAHRCLGAAAQSLGDRTRQTALGRGSAAVGHPLPRVSQHAGAGLASTTPRVWGPVVVGGGAPRQRARTLVSAHQ